MGDLSLDGSRRALPPAIDVAHFFDKDVFVPAGSGDLSYDQSERRRWVIHDGGPYKTVEDGGPHRQRTIAALPRAHYSELMEVAGGGQWPGAAKL